MLFYFAVIDVMRLLHTPRYLSLLDADIGTPRLIERVLREVESRRRALDVVRSSLRNAHERWKSPAVLVVPDTNTFIHGAEPFAGATWTTLSDAGGVRIIVPVLVIDELDALKRSGRKDIASKARVAVRTLVRLLGQSPEEPTRLGIDEQGRAVLIECLLDEPDHVRLSDADSEIVDRAAYVRDMSSQSVRVVTFDAGMKFRAAANGLEWAEISEWPST